MISEGADALELDYPVDFEEEGHSPVSSVSPMWKGIHSSMSSTYPRVSATDNMGRHSETRQT